MEPLAQYLWAQQPAALPLAAFAATFVSEEKGVATIDEALEGARHIVAETISEDADLRKALRQLMFDEGVVTSRKATDAVDEQEKFKMYYDYREPVKIHSLASHAGHPPRRRPKTSSSSSMELERSAPSTCCKPRILRAPGDWTPQLELAIEDAWQRLLNSSIQGEIRLELKKRSDADAIAVFRDNLHNLLLSPPAGPISVLGIDPGLRTGCKLAVVDETGKFLAHDVMYPLHLEERIGAGRQGSGEVDAQHNVRAIAIGNGTAGRETDQFVRDFLREQDSTTSSPSPSARAAPAFTPPPTWRARSFPISTSPCAAPSASRAACRTRSPSW